MIIESIMSEVFSKCIVKITISMVNYYNHAETTVYYRSGMTPDFVDRWHWYFDYLAARLKVAYPRRNVVLTCAAQEGIMLGKEWHEYRRGVMLRTARKKLTELAAMPVEDDLFGFGRSERDAKVAKWTAKLEALEADTYPIPESPEYLNRMKEFLANKE